uniref:C2 domain-containing protein n=1 Tax=Ciona savignyi TaxID=51511 RepID=H2YRM4_CIOSA
MLSKVELRISCKDLSSKDALSASDPVVVVKSREPSGKYTEVGRTEKVKNCNSPEFAEAIELDYRFEEFQQLKFKVIDIDNDSETLDDDDDLGSVELTLAQIVSEKELTKTLSKSSDQSDSTITIKATEITNVHEVEFSLRGEGLDKKDFLGKSDPFLEIYKSEPNEEWTLVYKSEIAKATLNPVWNKFSVRIQALCGGDMNSPIKCGVDFTGSNGDPRRKDSLHYLEGMRPNEYSQAIQSIGRVIQDYDSDQMYPAFGFGAKIPPNHEISHEFPLNMNPQNPYCQGVEGLMAAYHSAIRNVRLWGPTNIAPIINHVGRFAFEAQLNPKAAQYFVLLIITDGEITDMEETSHAIVRASRLPMSIIIVGVGNADFTAMEFLDGDDGVLTSFVDGSKAVRDVVQFVPFRKFKMSSVSALSSSVLGEIPQQVTEYFSMQNLPP